MAGDTSPLFMLFMICNLQTDALELSLQAFWCLHRFWLSVVGCLCCHCCNLQPC